MKLDKLKNEMLQEGQNFSVGGLDCRIAEICVRDSGPSILQIVSDDHIRFTKQGIPFVFDFKFEAELAGLKFNVLVTLRGVSDSVHELISGANELYFGQRRIDPDRINILN